MADPTHTKIVDYKEHKYHLVDPSPWPLVGSLSGLMTVVGAALFFHGEPIGNIMLPAGFLLILFTMYGWWSDVIKEAKSDKAHNAVVRHGLRLGMGLFIVSEVMFFFVFFWSFFKASIFPVDGLEGVWPVVEGIWPPEGIKTFDPFDLPFINTLILLLSGSTLTWAHYALMDGNKKDLVKFLGITVLLGILFTLTQAYEYSHAPFSFTEGIYPSNFYMATGFHGFHVIVGTIFLAVCYFRARKGQFTKENHLGFEFAAWYWHFVDVVWLFLFTFVYVWGG